MLNPLGLSGLYKAQATVERKEQVTKYLGIHRHIQRKAKDSEELRANKHSILDDLKQSA